MTPPARLAHGRCWRRHQVERMAAYLPTCPHDELRGTVQVLGDIESPVLPPSAWKAESDDH